MAIYTKTGDNGETGLYGGKRISKASLQVRAYGAIDELTVVIGLVIGTGVEKVDVELLTHVQKNLYIAMSVLSDAPVELEELEHHVIALEKYIDTTDASLPKLTRFILPQGPVQTMAAHQARVVCRRAEREVVEFASHEGIEEEKSKEKKTERDTIIVYLNRLSDALFIIARKYGHEHEIST